MPNGIQIVSLVIASGFLLWAIVSLVRAIVKKRKLKKVDFSSAEERSIEKKGEE